MSLSDSEAISETYGFSEATYRKAEGTDFARLNGLVETTEDIGSWWLRSPGLKDNYDLSNRKAQTILISGTLATGGQDITDDYVGVRPVICLDLSSEYVKKSN